MRAFLTGSRVYGKSRRDSDIDMVLLATEDELKTLLGQADSIGGSSEDDKEASDASLHFGRLNVIAMTDKTKFNLWKQGTDKLKAKAPVTREVAVKYLKRLLGK